jgi:hypothetical protein
LGQFNDITHAILDKVVILKYLNQIDISSLAHIVFGTYFSNIFYEEEILGYAPWSAATSRKLHAICVVCIENDRKYMHL